MIPIALEQIEAVQIVSHLAVVKGLFWLRCGKTMGSVCDLIVLTFLIIAVDNLLRRSCRVGRITEDSINAAIRHARSIDPAVLHVAFASICHTRTRERTRDTKVIDTATEVSEQRVVETADGVAITMQGALEALKTTISDGCPVTSVVDICAHEELQVLTCFHLLVELGMTFEVTCRCCRQHTQVEETLQLVNTILRIIDIDLRITLHFRIIHVVVMRLIVHHILQVVIVRHTHLHLVRIGLTTDMRQSIVTQPVTVLVPVELVDVWDVLYTVMVISV